MSLLDDDLFLAEHKVNRALAFWGNNSVALHRLIDDLNHETGKWMTQQDNEAVKVLLSNFRTAQTIIYDNYREAISKKLRSLFFKWRRWSNEFEDIPTLKPCPFCNDEAGILKTCPSSRGNQEFVVQCWSCNARTGYFSSPDEAPDAWNRRT